METIKDIITKEIIITKTMITKGQERISTNKIATTAKEIIEKETTMDTMEKEITMEKNTIQIISTTTRPITTRISRA
jgi:hypothetical protein